MGSVWRNPVLIASVQPNAPVNGTDNGSNNLDAPVLAAIGNDQMAMVYMQGGYANFPDLSYRSIVLQRVDPLGNTFGTPITITSSSYSPTLIGSVVSSPGVTALSNGSVAVSYTYGSYNTGTLRTDVFAKIVAPDGTVGAEIKLNTTAGNETNATITAVAGGGFLAVWQDTISPLPGGVGGDGSGSGINAQLFDAAGNKIGPQLAVNTATAGSQTNPSATTLSNGNILVSWISGANVEAQIYTSAGVAVGSEMTLSTAPGPSASVGYDKVVALSGGGFALVRDYTNTIIAALNPVIDVQVFDAVGTAVAPALQIDGVGTGYFINSIDAAAASDGGVTVTYSANDAIVGVTSVSRYHIASSGSLGDASTVTTASSSTSAIGAAAIAMYGDGREQIVWEQHQPGFADTLQESIYDDRNTTTFYATAAQPTAVGSISNDLIYGHAGADTLYGYTGNDILVGQGGDDIGYGGAGNDYFYAGAGNDTLFDDAGLDVLLGEDGNDVLHGGPGFNYLYGGNGNDILNGSGGAAPSDVNVMYGGDGADLLSGGVGTNYFYGGAGLDTMVGGSGLNIFISSGESDGNLIYGGSGQNYVYGSNGGDTVTGGAGVDVFLMGSGNDSITGGGGVDYAWGGGGSDTFTLDDSTSEVMVIQDFNAGGVNDLINFAETSLHSFADVQAASFYVAGTNTTIITDAAGNAVWLTGVAPEQLDASMFHFS
ncbi:calcium-binding protein [Bradyrhizobium elkanii]|uniref:calcium-binding protein n=1 Tax=Bradyrhizobium elkanii TaxID=29448 RepID=UPI0020A225CA|nr:calcium-binding protein [Bradyrhizobium elkanii]MCP1968369.1 Ca2+-binding RTX toxin-like protein [Bradyrhizobium elkanii]MCS4110131.1 Ca2+-binding RTX toxin-like protein [Bradyrhizobium elkanii]